MPEHDSETFDRDWLLVNAIRQAFGIGRKMTVTYAESVALTLDLAPEILSADSPLVKAFEAELVKLYRERAEARSIIENRTVKPVEILDADIQQLNNEARGARGGKAQSIEYQIRRLKKARIRLDQSSWTETQAINRDSDVYGTVLPISHKGQGYKEYKLPGNRRLRVRVLHPDPPEAHLGVDLVYESYYDKGSGKKKTTLVRIAALQYKMWDGINLYTSQATNLLPQLGKMQSTFCQGGFCEKSNSSITSGRYRLPNCCVFLRPTDRKQTKDAWQVTHAWHVPVCTTLAKFETTTSGNRVLRSNQISNSAVTQSTFQELFNRGMLGSRWLGSKMLASLYQQAGVFDDLENIVVHSQEY